MKPRRKPDPTPAATAAGKALGALAKLTRTDRRRNGAAGARKRWADHEPAQTYAAIAQRRWRAANRAKSRPTKE